MGLRGSVNMGRCKVLASLSDSYASDGRMLLAEFGRGGFGSSRTSGVSGSPGSAPSWVPSTLVLPPRACSGPDNDKLDLLESEEWHEGRSFD